MSRFRDVLSLALVAAPTTAVVAAGIPGGPGTGATLSLVARIGTDLGSRSDADWFRTSLQAGKLHAFTFDTPNVADVSVRDAGGKACSRPT